MAGAASHAADADSSRAPGLTFGLQGSVNVHRGDLLLLPPCISSFVFYYIAYVDSSTCILHIQHVDRMTYHYNKFIIRGSK